MSRSVKELIGTNLKSRYADLDSVLVVSMHGLNGTDANTVRGELRKKEIEVHVVKNRLVSRVLDGTPLAPIRSALHGPCAFVTCPSGPIDAAKELIRLAKEYPALELRAGVVDGEPDVIPIAEIARRKSKAELQGDIVALAVAPGRRIAGCLNAGGKIAGCIKAIVDKLEKGEEIKRVA